jgi:hypothetical protein
MDLGEEGPAVLVPSPSRSRRFAGDGQSVNPIQDRRRYVGNCSQGFDAVNLGNRNNALRGLAASQLSLAVLRCRRSHGRLDTMINQAVVREIKTRGREIVDAWDSYQDTFPRVTALLTAHGHSPDKAGEIVLLERRKDAPARQWIKVLARAAAARDRYQRALGLAFALVD